MGRIAGGLYDGIPHGPCVQGVVDLSSGSASRELSSRTYVRPDGRRLHLYGAFSGEPRWPSDEAANETSSHMRWHPLRHEWVVYSAHRQSRTYKPPANDCPFCPNTPDGEVPLDDFSIAVFDNKFPSLQKNPAEPDRIPGLDVAVGPAVGHCEVIVYSADHRASMGTLPQERRELLIRVWGERVRSLLENPDINAVMPFENRGEEAGVTLHHPHGQIYAFSYLPPVIDGLARGFRDGFDLSQLAGREAYAVDQSETAVALVPPFARFPFEVWIAPKRFRPSPASLEAAEVRDFAKLLASVQKRYDRFFGRICAYVMVVYAAPRGMEAFFPFHMQFYPLLRSSQKLKYIAGCELGAGTFLADVLPEAAAQSLRNVHIEGGQ